ncbi:MAG: T9SS type A sorting domain-containing protein [Bacteroidota bacterium]
MKKTIMLFFSLICVSSLTWAQYAEDTYQQVLLANPVIKVENGKNVSVGTSASPRQSCILSDGSVLACFATNYYDRYEKDYGYVLSKTDAEGFLIWTKRFNIALPPHVPNPNKYDVFTRPTDDGGAIVCAFWEIFKIDASGDIVWQYRIDQSQTFASKIVDLELKSNGQILLLCELAIRLGSPSKLLLHQIYSVLELSKNGEGLANTYIDYDQLAFVPSMMELDEQDRIYLGGTRVLFMNGPRTPALARLDENGQIAYSILLERGESFDLINFKIRNQALYAACTAVNTDTRTQASNLLTMFKLSLEGEAINSWDYTSTDYRFGTRHAENFSFMATHDKGISFLMKNTHFDPSSWATSRNKGLIAKDLMVQLTVDFDGQILVSRSENIKHHSVLDRQRSRSTLGNYSYYLTSNGSNLLLATYAELYTSSNSQNPVVSVGIKKFPPISSLNTCGEKDVTTGVRSQPFETSNIRNFTPSLQLPTVNLSKVLASDSLTFRPDQTQSVRVCESIQGAGTTSTLRESPIRSYPNPVKDIMTIEMQGLAGTMTLQLQSPDGRIYKRLTVDMNPGEQLEMDMSDIQEGVYILTVSGNDISERLKLIVTK